MDDSDFDFDLSLPSILGPSAAVDQAIAEASKQDGAAPQLPAPPLTFPPQPNSAQLPPLPPVAAAAPVSVASPVAFRSSVQDQDAYNKAGNGHLLGLSILFAGIGTWVGSSYLGSYGAAGGSLAGGALANFVRSYRYSKVKTPAGKSESTLSLTYGVILSGISGYLLFEGYKKKTAPRRAEGTES